MKAYDCEPRCRLVDSQYQVTILPNINHMTVDCLIIFDTLSFNYLREPHFSSQQSF